MERDRGAVAATAMGADAARKHRRKATKAAAENMVRGSLQSVACKGRGSGNGDNGTSADIRRFAKDGRGRSRGH